MADCSILMENIDGDGDMMKTILGMFIEDYQDAHNTFSELINLKNWVELSRECHGLKGVLMGIGPTELSDVLLKIEKRWADGTQAAPEDIQALLTMVPAYLADIKTTVEAL